MRPSAMSYPPPRFSPPVPNLRQEIARRQVACVLYLLLIAAAMVVGSRLGTFAFIEPVCVGIVAFIATALALGDSRHLTPFVTLVWVVAPFIRRVIDYQRDEYTSVTIISLLPMLATASLIIPTLPRIGQLPAKLRTALILMAIPMCYAAVVGVARYGLSAVFEAASWLGPALFLPYLATRRTSDLVRRYWLQSLVILSAASAAYGIVQYFTAPAWDMLWLSESGMTGSMGQAEAMRFRVFSTMNSTGTAAVFWAMTLPIATIHRPIRGPLGFALAILIAVALALSLVRIGWLMAIAGVIVLVVRSRGSQRAQNVGILALATILMVAALPLMPGGDRVVSRFTSFGQLSEDNSFRVRQSISVEVAKEILRNPIGTGIGSVAAGKMSGQSRGVTGVDNGYADIVLRLGLPGACIFALGVILFVRYTGMAQRRVGRSTFHTSLGHAATAALAMVFVGTLSINMIVGISGLCFWIAHGLFLNTASDEAISVPVRL